MNDYQKPILNIYENHLFYGSKWIYVILQHLRYSRWQAFPYAIFVQYGSA